MTRKVIVPDVQLMPCPQCGIGIWAYKGSYVSPEAEDAYRVAKRRVKSVRRKLKADGVSPAQIEAHERLMAAKADAECAAAHLNETRVEGTHIVCSRCGFIGGVGGNHHSCGRVLAVWLDGAVHMCCLQPDKLEEWIGLLSNPAAACEELKRCRECVTDPIYVQLTAWDYESKSLQVLGELGDPVALSSVPRGCERRWFIIRGKATRFLQEVEDVQTPLMMVTCPSCGMWVDAREGGKLLGKIIGWGIQNAQLDAKRILAELKAAGIPQHLIDKDEDMQQAREIARRLEESNDDCTVTDCKWCGTVKAGPFLYQGVGRLVVVWPDSSVDDAMVYSLQDLMSWMRLMVDPCVAYAEINRVFAREGQPFYVQLNVWDDHFQWRGVLGELGHPVALSVSCWHGEDARGNTE